METCNSANPIFMKTAGKFLAFRFFSRCRLSTQVFSLESSWILLISPHGSNSVKGPALTAAAGRSEGSGVFRSASVAFLGYSATSPTRKRLTTRVTKGLVGVFV